MCARVSRPRTSPDRRVSIPQAPLSAKWRCRMLKTCISLGKFDPSCQLSQLAEWGGRMKNCMTLALFVSPMQQPGAGGGADETGVAAQESVTDLGLGGGHGEGQL